MWMYFFPILSMVTSTSSPVAVGDIFESSWGYSMTIVDFFQVTRVSGSRVYFREIESAETASGYLSGTSLPVRDSFKGAEHFSTLRNRGRMSILVCPNDSSDYKVPANLWEGRPCYFNHCD
jgi:hypothetical protein